MCYAMGVEKLQCLLPAPWTKLSTKVNKISQLGMRLESFHVTTNVTLSNTIVYT